MTKQGLDAPDVLADGAWVAVRGVMRWVDGEPAKPAPLDVALLIACPFCRARVTETCHSRTGLRCEPHSVRIVRSRRCPCGAQVTVRTRKPPQLCEDCRADSRRQTWRLNKQRQRRRAA